MTALACFILIYLATFEQSYLIIFPAVLLISGLVLQIYFSRKIEVVDSLAQSAPNILFYTLVALAGIALASFVAPLLQPPVQKMQLTSFHAMLYSLLIAVAEEQFFRGALLNFLLSSFKGLAFLAIALNATVFTVYHFAVYQTSLGALAYVFVGGLVLAWVAWRSNRLSPSMLAHAINNLIASLV
jgi:membrane protease YdiL (CAAX protease family)